MPALGIDVGGTFTDAVLVSDGVVRTAKVPTAARQEESVVAAAAVRELRLQPCRLSLLTLRRTLSRRGAEGGADCLSGRNLFNGRELPAFATLDLQAGDLLRIETPGGGWGEPGRHQEGLAKRFTEPRLP